MAARELRFEAGAAGEVSALLELPAGALRLLVLAHGAGAGMRHRFLEAVAARLAARGIGTFRYQFPYMEAGRKSPDRPPKLVATVRAAVEAAAREAPGLPLLAGGKSMGGRMTSTAAAEQPLPGVRGLVFFGFPLHPPGRPGTERADHLAAVTVPMLFLQGTRDDFAGLDLLRPVLDRLAAPVTLHVVDGADHSFGVRKSTGRSHAEVLDDLTEAVVDWSGRA